MYVNVAVKEQMSKDTFHGQCSIALSGMLATLFGLVFTMLITTL